MEWLGAIFAFLAVYSYLITGESNLSDELQLHIKLLPIYLIISFGVSAFIHRKTLQFDEKSFFSSVKCCLFLLLQMYAVVTVLYRTFTFNDCPEAAEELQKHIEEAKADLSAKGFKF